MRESLGHWKIIFASVSMAIFNWCMTMAQEFAKNALQNVKLVLKVQSSVLHALKVSTELKDMIAWIDEPAYVNLVIIHFLMECAFKATVRLINIVANVKANFNFAFNAKLLWTESWKCLNTSVFVQMDFMKIRKMGHVFHALADVPNAHLLKNASAALLSRLITIMESANAMMELTLEYQRLA